MPNAHFVCVCVYIFSSGHMGAGSNAVIAAAASQAIAATQQVRTFFSFFCFFSFFNCCRRMSCHCKDIFLILLPKYLLFKIMFKKNQKIVCIASEVDAFVFTKIIYKFSLDQIWNKINYILFYS